MNTNKLLGYAVTAGKVILAVGVGAAVQKAMYVGAMMVADDTEVCVKKANSVINPVEARVERRGLFKKETVLYNKRTGKPINKNNK